MKTKVRAYRVKCVGQAFKHYNREAVRRGPRGQGHTWLHNYPVSQNGYKG